MPLPRCFLVGLVVPLVLAVLPARAGSVTEDSILDRQSALNAALQQVPAGATVTRKRCQEIVLPGNSYRYRCSVEYTDAPPAGSAGSGSP